MKKYLICLCIICANAIESSDISNAESSADSADSSIEVVESMQDFDVKKYGKHLYENPRGIACDKCHGKQGEGSIIANYKHKGANKTLIAPRINNIELDRFYKALHSQRGIMPIYYLSDDEIVAIYEYLKQ